MLQTFTVNGMTCGHCEQAVRQAILQIDPQAQVDIHRSTAQVQVESAASKEQLAAAIAEEGYHVSASLA